MKANDYGIMLSCSDELVEDYATKKELRQAMKDWPHDFKKVFPDATTAPAVYPVHWNGVYWQGIKL